MKTRAYYIKIILIGFISGICNGVFGAGGGMILVPGMTSMLKIEDHNAHATAVSVILPLACASSYIYLSNGIVDYKLLTYIVSGGMLGSFLGARLMNKLPAKYLRKIFSVFMFIAAIRMIF
ncbi:MAG: sulfite exporter TauE/SafE family protein [Clostridia bacterium]|nr:sulfite exporter TauE/SafE family protein [Clostridia bacterium]